MENINISNNDLQTFGVYKLGKMSNVRIGGKGIVRYFGATKSK